MKMSSQMEKDLFKLINNSIYGKTMKEKIKAKKHGFYINECLE